MIETTQGGRGNWASDKLATPDSPRRIPPQRRGGTTDIGLPDRLTVGEWTLTWRNGITGGQAVTGTLNSLELQEPSETSPVTFQFVATYVGIRFEAKGETGSMARLSDTVVEDTVAGEADGQLGTARRCRWTRNRRRRCSRQAIRLKQAGSWPDLAQLQPFVLARLAAALVRQLSFSANIADSGPLLMHGIGRDFTLHAGASDLSAYAAGVTLTTG